MSILAPKFLHKPLQIISKNIGSRKKVILVSKISDEENMALYRK